MDNTDYLIAGFIIGVIISTLVFFYVGVVDHKTIDNTGKEFCARFNLSYDSFRITEENTIVFQCRDIQKVDTIGELIEVKR